MSRTSKDSTNNWSNYDSSVVTDIDKLERLLIIYASEIYKLAAAGNSDFAKPTDETKAAINALLTDTVVAELEKLIQPSAIHGYFMSCSGNDIYERIKTVKREGI